MSKSKLPERVNPDTLIKGAADLVPTGNVREVIIKGRGRTQEEAPPLATIKKRKFPIV